MNALLWSLISNTVVLVVCVWLFFVGSLEMFPTEEQTGTARLVWGLLLGVFVVIEVTIIILIKKHGR